MSKSAKRGASMLSAISAQLLFPRSVHHPRPGNRARPATVVCSYLDRLDQR